MITVCAFIAAWAAVVAYIGREEGWPDDAVGVVMCGFMLIMTFLLSVLVGGGVALGIGAGLPTRIDTAPSERAQLVSLRSVDGVQGDFRGGFFLGVGHIGSELYYFWYERAGKAVTPRQRAAGKGTYVYEEQRDDAEVLVYRWHFTRAWWTLFAIEPDDVTTWEFHVPIGTVKQGYSL